MARIRPEGLRTRHNFVRPPEVRRKDPRPSTGIRMGGAGRWEMTVKCNQGRPGHKLSSQIQSTIACQNRTLRYVYNILRCVYGMRYEMLAGRAFLPNSSPYKIGCCVYGEGSKGGFSAVVKSPQDEIMVIVIKYGGEFLIPWYPERIPATAAGSLKLTALHAGRGRPGGKTV